MLFFIKDDQGNIVEAATYSTHDQRIDQKIVCRHDWETFEDAEKFAAKATFDLGEPFIPTDAGSHVHPRFDVVRPPKIGDKVSKTVNGDYYPCGEIVKISKSLRRVETDTGAVFWRRRKSGAWVKGGCWSMVPGHIKELNPSF